MGNGFEHGLENIKEAEKNSRRRLFISVLKICLLLLIVVGLPLYIWFFHQDWVANFKSLEDAEAYLESYETESIFIYIGLQMLQVIISFLPGQVFQMAAGYLYTFWPALLFALIGATGGTIISFVLARVLGRDFLHLFFGEEKTSYYIERLNSKRAYAIVFFLYLIPGLPKDVVSYAAGASMMRWKPFLLLSTLGRLPGMVGCLLIGTLLDTGNYVGVAIVSVVAVVAFIVCLVLRKPINRWLDKMYEKIAK